MTKVKKCDTFASKLDAGILDLPFNQCVVLHHPFGHSEKRPFDSEIVHSLMWLLCNLSQNLFMEMVQALFVFSLAVPGSIRHI